MPLMPGYCFVHISSHEYDKVLQTNHVVCYVTFEGKAAVIPEWQIESLKQMLKQQVFDVEVTHESFTPGKMVEIIEGPLVGVQGELLAIRGKNKFVLRLEQINTIFTIEVPASYLSFLPKEMVKN
jgi:transcription antitermination factor NusG